MSSGLHDPPWGESDTRSKLIDPAIHARGWTEEHIRREETAGAIEIIDGRPRRRSRGRVDYTLRVKVSAGVQPVALAIIEAKAENLPPGHEIFNTPEIRKAGGKDGPIKALRELGKPAEVLLDTKARLFAA